MRVFLVIFTFIVLTLGAWYWFMLRGASEGAIEYRAAAIERGTIIRNIRATGIVQPIKEVAVGTQVNGRVIRLYADYNSVVTNNQIVALIDPDVYEATHARDMAQLKSNQATVEQTKTRLAFAEKDLLRKVELAQRTMLSDAELDAAEAERDVLVAQLKMAEAAVEQADAAVKLSRANLEYCTIRAPVDGVVIARNVDEGQTVVSALNAQQIFSIATGLKRIQVEASVPESDVGLIKVGHPVRFTVDAYQEEFEGTVRQIRLAASTVQNVVTYPVIVEADNPNKSLFPGMTAGIAIEVDRQEDALMVPAAALRFAPPGQSRDESEPAIWLLDDEGNPRRQAVKIGLSDSAKVAVDVGYELEGRKVIVGVRHSGATAAAKNPFMPSIGGDNAGSISRLIQ